MKCWDGDIFENGMSLARQCCTCESIKYDEHLPGRKKNCCERENNLISLNFFLVIHYLGFLHLTYSTSCAAPSRHITLGNLIFHPCTPHSHRALRGCYVIISPTALWLVYFA